MADTVPKKRPCIRRACGTWYQFLTRDKQCKFAQVEGLIISLELPREEDVTGSTHFRIFFARTDALTGAANCLDIYLPLQDHLNCISCIRRCAREFPEQKMVIKLKTTHAFNKSVGKDRGASLGMEGISRH